MPSPRLAVLAGALALAGCAATPTATTAGHVAAEARIFWQPPRYAGQEQGSGVSLVAEPELDVKSEDEVQELVARPYYRLDPYDSRRSHFDVRKASYRIEADGWEAGLGAGQFTWGALESHRPVDIVNQVDLVDSLDGSAKLGQPFVEVGYAGEVASLRLYYLPLFRERTFPGVDGRLRFAAPIDGENAAFEPDLGRWTPSGAARLALRGGDFDVGLSVFSGLSREPRFVVELTRARVVPLYDLLQQGSVDAQWTHDALALKAEGFVRLWTRDFRPFAGGGAGAEYSFFDIVDGWDVTVVAEMLLDGRRSRRRRPSSSTTPSAACAWASTTPPAPRSSAAPSWTSSPEPRWRTSRPAAASATTGGPAWPPTSSSARQGSQRDSRVLSWRTTTPRRTSLTSSSFG
ncbi:MAG: hypothetical protein WKG00_05650 [Polyangiaceae bacterium]